MKFNKTSKRFKTNNKHETIKNKQKRKNNIIKITNTPTQQFETIKTITNASKPIKQQTQKTITKTVNNAKTITSIKKILQQQIKTMKTNTKTKQIKNCKHNKNKHNHIANHTTYETNTKSIKTIKPMQNVTIR